MPENKTTSKRGPAAALSVDLGMEKGMKKRQILLDQKVKVAEVHQAEEDYLLSDNSLQGSPTSTLSPAEATTQQLMLGMNNNCVDKEDKEEKAGLTLEQFTDIVLAQEGIDPDRVAVHGGKSVDASRQVILPSVRGSQRLQGEKLKPVVLTPRSVAAPQAAVPLPTSPSA